MPSVHHTRHALNLFEYFDPSGKHSVVSIRAYDDRIAKLATENYRHTELLRQVKRE
jgi:hypothetical protein